MPAAAGSDRKAHCSPHAGRASRGPRAGRRGGPAASAPHVRISPPPGSYTRWLCRERWQSEDLVQETVLRAWRSWPGLREHRAVKGWLFKILYHEFARATSRGRIQTVPLEELVIDPQDHADPALAVDMVRALDTLGEHSRHALLLQVLGGLSCAEIAAVLSTSEGAVMTRLTRARQALRRVLQAGEQAEAKKA
ncbi:MAG: sigma-70 family RNA polymerase sigma factor [Woeseiaceae bacterium]